MPSRLFRSFALGTLLLAASSALAPAPARAAWNAVGNAIATGTGTQNPTTHAGTSVCTDELGGLICAYKDGASAIEIQRLGVSGLPVWTAGGVSVTAGLGLASGTDNSPRVAPDSAGGAWVAWVDNRAAAPGLYVQHYTGAGVAQFEAGGRLVSAGDVASSGDDDLDIEVTPAGELLLAFWDAGLRVQRVNTSGLVELPAAGQLMSVSDLTGSWLDLCADGDGGVVVWISGRAALGSVQSVAANRFGPTGAIAWGTDGVPVMAGGTSYCFRPRAAWDGSSLFVTCSYYSPDGGNLDEVHAQRLNSAGVRQWSPNSTGRVVRPVLDTPWNPSIELLSESEVVSDGAGGCIIAWMDQRDFFRTGSNGFQHRSDVYAQRLDAAGAALWTANGAPVDTALGEHREVRMIADGASGAIVVYEDFLGFNQDVTARRIGPTGTSVWVDNLVNTTTGDQAGPVIAPDGAAGFLVAWQDPRDSATNGIDVYGTHVNIAGGAFAPGLTLVAPNGGESLQSLVPTDVTWASTIPGNVRILAREPSGAQVTVAGTTSNDGAFSWPPPYTAPTTIRVKVMSLTDSTFRDSSDADVSVCPTFVAQGGVAAPYAYDFRLADIDEDGRLDLVFGVALSPGVEGLAFAKGLAGGAFAPAVTSAFVEGPIRIRVADLDDDGILDVVGTRVTGWSVFLGNGVAGVGDGTFRLGASATGGLPVDDVHLADLDRDGVEDLVTTHSAADSISVWRGSGSGGVGDGTFLAPARYAAGDGPVDVIDGDFNEDGTPDLAVVTPDPGNGALLVFLGIRTEGLSTGAFLPGVSYPLTFPGARHLVRGDFDENGITDIAVSTLNRISVLLGQGAGAVGNGTFAAPVAYFSPSVSQDIRVADVQRDGRLDFVVAGSTVGVLTGLGTGATGDGTFATGGAMAPNGLDRLELGDFDADGRLDAVFLDSGPTGSYHVLLGGCLADLASTVTLTSPNAGQTLRIGPTNTALVQWTKSADVIGVDVQLSRNGGTDWQTVARDLPGGLYVWPITGPPTEQALFRVVDSRFGSRVDASNVPFTICGPLALGAAVPAGTNATALAVADFDDDGHLDVAAAGGGIKVLPGDGAGGFGAAITSFPTSGLGDIEPADVNDDGRLDLLALRGASLQTLFAGGSGGVGDGTFASATGSALTRTGGRVGVGDFDEDGIVDAAVTSATDSLVLVMRGQGANGVGNGSFTQTAALGVFDTPRDVLVGDFDENGIQDLAVTNHAGALGRLSILLGAGAGGAGNGGFAPPAHYLSGLRPAAIASGDFDGDGILDLAVAMENTPPGVIVHRGQGALGVGNGTFAVQRGYAVTTVPLDVATGDFNGDGLLDLAVLETGGAVTILARTSSNAAFGIWFAPLERRTLAGASPVELAVTDFDANGGADLVASLGGANAVQPLLGDCAPTGLPVIGLSTPLGGEGWLVGSEQAIQWVPGNPGDVHVELSRDGGANWERIATGVLGNPVNIGLFVGRTFTWTVTGPPTPHARVRVVDAHRPQFLSASPADFNVHLTPVGVESERVAEASFAVEGTNPTAGEHRLAFALPSGGHVRVEVFDAAGRRVNVLADAAFAAGRHSVAWDGRDARGRDGAAGVYFARARWPGFERVVRLVRMP